MITKTEVRNESIILSRSVSCLTNISVFCLSPMFYLHWNAFTELVPLIDRPIIRQKAKSRQSSFHPTLLITLSNWKPRHSYGLVFVSCNRTALFAKRSDRLANRLKLDSFSERQYVSVEEKGEGLGQRLYSLFLRLSFQTLHVSLSLSGI